MRFFQQKREGDKDAKSVRDELLYFIRQKLSAWEGGEGSHIRGMRLYLAPKPEERALYEAAVHYDDEGRFREEVQRIADDFDVRLPAQWSLELLFVDTLPDDAVVVPNHPAALWLNTLRKSPHRNPSAQIRVLNGEAEQQQYVLQPDGSRVNIGREKTVQLRDGFFRTNTIAFKANSSEEANKFVSRQHAHIRFDTVLGAFLLFVDEGGLPPQNKTKVKGRNEPQAVKLQSTEVPHMLRDGDQIILGSSALLEFNDTEQKEQHG